MRKWGEPLTFHHETFSRFRFVIINKDKRLLQPISRYQKSQGFLREIKIKICSKKMNSDENKMMRALKFNAKALQKLVHKVIGTRRMGKALQLRLLILNSPAFKLTIGSGTLKGKHLPEHCWKILK